MLEILNLTNDMKYSFKIISVEVYYKISELLINFVGSACLDPLFESIFLSFF